MKGSVLKDAIKAAKKTQADFAEYMGMTQANVSALLTADNVKTETLEAVAEFLWRSAGSFYGEGDTAVADHGSTAVAGNGNTLADHALIDEIAAQRRLTEQAMSQNDRLIGIINNLTKE